jgi:hypothetical protein
MLPNPSTSTVLPNSVWPRGTPSRRCRMLRGGGAAACLGG